MLKNAPQFGLIYFNAIFMAQFKAWKNLKTQKKSSIKS